MPDVDFKAEHLRILSMSGNLVIYLLFDVYYIDVH
jgi:hypothetical protein